MDAQTIRLKLSAVPQRIKEWFGSEDVVAQIREINKHFNVAGDNRSAVPRLLLRLEIHDLEPDYFAGELAKELELDRDKALAISAEVKRTVLGPIKKELATEEIDISLLDQFRAPIVKKTRTEEGPAIIKEIKPLSPIAAIAAGVEIKPTSPPPTVPSFKTSSGGAGPIDIEKIFSSTGSPRVSSMPPPRTITPPAAGATKPEGKIFLPAFGPQSGARQGGRIEDILKSPAPPPPAKSPQRETSAGKPFIPPVPPFISKRESPMSEFERLGLAKKLGEETTPTVLYREDVAKQSEKTAGFKLEAPIPKFSDAKSTQPPTKPAILEFGGMKNPEKQAPRVVNYTGPKTLINERGVPGAPAEGREIKEITSEAPATPRKPETPPAPPAPPKPLG